VSGEESPQLGEAVLHGARGNDKLVAMPVPERLTIASAGTPTGEARNVGGMYTLFARAIRDSGSAQPTFETAVELHRLIDSIRRASDSGREVTVG
jgi:hypothetical protein